MYRSTKGEGQGDAASKDLQQVTNVVSETSFYPPSQVAVVYQKSGYI